MVYCAHCRRALIPHDSGNKDPSGRPYRYYDCGQIVRSSRDHVCPVGRIAAGSLESVVVGFLAELGRRPEVTRAALTESRAQQRVDRSPLRASLAETEKSLAEVNRQVDNCVEAIAVGGAEVFGDELKQRTLRLRERRQELIVEREQARQELRACDEALLDERRVLAAVDRLGEALPRMKPEAQKEFVALIVDRIEVRALRPDRVKVSQRPLQFAIKLHLPKLVEGMEERVIVDGTVRSRILPRQRSLNLSMQVALGGQGAGGASIILAPFAHRVLSARGTNAAPTETARHAIHRAFQWQRALQDDPTLEKQALAAQEEVAPGSITHHLKLLELTPEIQNFLRGLKDPDAVRYYSLRKMRRLSELPADGQSVQFNRLQHGFRAGLSGG